jgi:hypothetical protein
MTTPCRITQHAASTKGRRDELGHATIAAVGEDASVPLAQDLDLGPPIVDWIVAIPGAARNRRKDREITTTHQYLCVAGVTVVLGLRGMRVVPRWNQRSVDDPRPAPVMTTRPADERSKSRCDRRDDPMRRRLRDLEHRGELANRQVRSQRDAGDQHSVTKRARPRSSTSALGWKSAHHERELTAVDRGE